MKSSLQRLSARFILLGALLLSIPAFYLVLMTAETWYYKVGHGLYGVVALLIAMAFFVEHKYPEKGHGGMSLMQGWGRIDALILLGALASAWPVSASGSGVEWALRLSYCGVIFLRLSVLLAKYVEPHRLLQTCALALLVLALAGAGFVWLEPRVQSYADGLWLAFITGATVGYGDLVPSTAASRIFAAFIVLLGYALFSVVTASIAALLVGEDEKRLRRELHADMRVLHEEIVALRAALANSTVVSVTAKAAEEMPPAISQRALPSE